MTAKSQSVHLLGSSGFIGKAIKKQAAQQNIYLHSWSHTPSPNSNYFDLYDPSSWNNLFNSNIESLIILSWPGLPNYDNPLHLTKNLPAFINLIDGLSQLCIKRLVIVGTCYEYGRQNGCLREDMFTDPVNAYAIAKDSLRRYVQHKLIGSQLSWAWTRIFYPFGEGQSQSCLIPSLLQAINTGEKIFNIGSGRQIRDFISVEDVSKHLIFLATRTLESGIFNIGTGKPKSVLEFVTEAKDLAGSDISIHLNPSKDRSSEPLAFWADTDKLNSLYMLHDGHR